MTQIDKAAAAVDRAQMEDDAINRSLWLAKAADYAIKDRAVLVGGTAVNLHTGSYRPTDIDMCARLEEADRQALVELGFRHTQGDHFSFDFEDGEVWLLDFPSSSVDGDVASILLSRDDSLYVIALESLVVDRILQATDGTTVTFDDRVDEDVRRRSSLEPGLHLHDTYRRVVGKARALMDAVD
jgi:hypothetical protein